LQGTNELQRRLGVAQRELHLRGGKDGRLVVPPQPIRFLSLSHQARGFSGSSGGDQRGHRPQVGLGFPERIEKSSSHRDRLATMSVRRLRPPCRQLG